jgi:hypothetical protein
MQRNGQKRGFKKIDGKRRQDFFFLPQKVFYGVFELSLLRNAQKRLKKRYLPTPFSGHLPDIRRFRFFSFFGAPWGWGIRGVVVYMITAWAACRFASASAYSAFS